MSVCGGCAAFASPPGARGPDTCSPPLDHSRQWMEDTKDVDFTDPHHSQPEIVKAEEPRRVEAFLTEVEGHHAGVSFEVADRLFRAHGRWGGVGTMR